MIRSPRRTASRGVQADDWTRVLALAGRARRHWRLAAAVCAACVATGAAVAILRAPSYRSEAVVLARAGVRLQGGPEPPVGASLGARLRELLVARGRLEPIAREFGLYPDVLEKRGIGEVVELVRADLQFQSRANDTFVVSFVGRDPELARAVVERLVRALGDEHQRLRLEQARAQSEFVAAERLRAEDRLKESERVLAEFVANHPEFALDTRAGTTGASIRARASAPRPTASKDPEVEALRRQSERLALSIDSAGRVRPSGGDKAAEREAEAARNRAESLVAAARDELRARRSRFTDEHPDVKAAKARLTELEAQLRSAEERAELASTATALPQDDEERTELREKRRMLDAEIALRERNAASRAQPAAPSPGDAATAIVDIETTWARLSRNVEEARDQVDELERSDFRAQIESSSSLGGYSDTLLVLDPPFRPTRPLAPTRATILAVFGAIGVAAGTLAAALRALFDRRLGSVSEAEAIVPVLAVLPCPGATRARIARSAG